VLGGRLGLGAQIIHGFLIYVYNWVLVYTRRLSEWAIPYWCNRITSIAAVIEQPIAVENKSPADGKRYQNEQRGQR
jgi:hypothetical protein